MQNFEERFPNNGLNTDDENRVLSINESRYILNLRAGTSDGDNVGAIENIKGNTEVVFTLPQQGINKCIGSHSDQTTHSNFFFLWSSIGQHGIYRYFPQTKEVRLLVRDSKLNFQEFDLINDINIVGDLLYWRDVTNPPRKINIKKADTSDPNFRQKFNWYLGDEYINGKTSLELRITIRSSAYNLPVTTLPIQTFSINSALDKKEIAKAIAAQINGNSLIALTAEACGDFVSMESSTTDFYSITALDNGLDTVQVVPQNFYTSYVGRNLDVIKYPPRVPLRASIQSDTTFGRNFIKEKVFQFAARYIYDDNEKTTISPYSLNTFISVSCGNASTDRYNNYIKLDLSVLDELNDINEVQSIKKIELFVKEGVLGKWKSIKTLEQAEFIDTSNQQYKFYNDGLYKAVDQTRFADLYSLVPRRTKNQEVAKDRLFYANNLEGFDNVCVDANIDLTYNDVEANRLQPTYTISGQVFIRSQFNGNNNKLSQHQAIYTEASSDNTSSKIWGGISDTVHCENLISKTNQTIELGGFLVYLTGTEHKAISQQNISFGKKQPNQTEQSYIQNIRNLINGSTLNATYWGEQTSSGIQNTFTIPDVPDGWYILRVASHLTTQAEYVNPNRPYESSSTNVFKITNLDASTGNGDYSTQVSGDSELLIHVQGGNIPRIKIEVMDLSNADIANDAKILTGYVTDNDTDAAVVVGNYANFMADTRISNAEVTFNIARSSGSTNYLAAGGKTAITDHNGYFFYSSRFVSQNLSISSIRQVGISSTSYLFSSRDKLTQSNNTDINSISPRYKNIVTKSAKGASLQARTKVTGFINTQNGNGVDSAVVVSIRAQKAITNKDGKYEFWHYGIINNTVTSTQIVASQIDDSKCTPRYSNAIYDFGFDYLEWFNNTITDNQVPGFTPNGSANRFPLTLLNPSFIGLFPLVEITNAMKRGWDGEFGILYTDEGMRGGNVNTSKEIKLHIPFYTEKDENGIVNRGVPVLNWSIKHAPPKWATHYHWVRTKNLYVGSYFHWNVKDITYYDGSANVTNPATAVSMGIDLTNLADYKQYYPKLELDVDLNSPNLRIRVIKNQWGVYYNDYIDLKVASWSGAILTVLREPTTPYIAPGSLIEIYNELSDIETDVFYEMSESFEIGTDVNGNKFHKGLTQNQDPLNPSTTPATGTFRSGDAYYRTRLSWYGTVHSFSFIDDDAVSDFYPSEVESIGRPNAINPDAKEGWKPTQIRHSQKNIPDSNVNGFSYFVSDNFNPLPLEYGAINKLILSSNVLMSIHEFRWVSNYIEESLVRQQDGTDQLIATKSVFGSFRAPEMITGTINQESVKEYKGNIYAFDLNKGIVTRWGADGLTPISAYKAVNYFRSKSKSILSAVSNNPVNIIASYDSEFNEYVVTFPEIKDIKSGFTIKAETIAFSEPLNKWISFYSFIPEMYGNIDLSMLSFKDGKLWVHNTNNLRNHFYGTKYPSQVELNFNDKPGQVKVYKALGVESYHPWEAVSVKTPNGMETIMYKERFVRREDGYYAPVMKDINTGGFSNQNEAILNGRDLRDRTIDVLLENKETDEVILFSASMLSVLSARHQK